MRCFAKLSGPICKYDGIRVPYLRIGPFNNNRKEILMYELTVTARFAAAHQLREYSGKCENLHGHNWKVEAIVSAAALNEIGLAIDFKEIKESLHETLDQLDHTFLNDLPMFKDDNPSSENIARWIFERLCERLDQGNVCVARIVVWESEDACASYFRD